MSSKKNYNIEKSNNENYNDMMNKISKPNNCLCSDFQDQRSSSLAEDLKANYFQNEENIANKDTRENSSVDIIDDFIQISSEFDDDNFMFKLEEKVDDENNKKTLQNNKNDKVVLKKIKQCFYKEENNKDIINCEEYYLLEKFVSYLKQYDKNSQQMYYKKINKIKNFYIELKNLGYTLSSIKNDSIISNSNVIKFLNNHINKFAINLFNKLIDKVNKEKNCSISHIKNVRKIIFECVNIRYINILFNSDIEKILSNQLNEKYKKAKVGYNKKKYNNSYILNQLKQQDFLLIQQMIKLKFFNLYYIYIFEDNLNFLRMNNINLLDDDLKEDGKWYKSEKNKKLTKEMLKRKSLKIRYIAYKNYLSIIQPRNIIREESIEKFNDTNFSEEIKNEFLNTKRKSK